MVIMNTAGYNIEEYIKELASKTPVPGGGGASAVAGALSAALSSMVCNLTIGKKSFAAVEEDIKNILSDMNKHMESFIKLSDKDAQVFYPLSQAYGFKPQNEEEKALHEANMEKLLFDAAIVPLDIMKEANSMLNSIDFLAKKGSKLAISDAGVAVGLLRSAVCGAMMNVVINVKYMKDRDIAQRLLDEASEILEDTMNKSDIIYREVLEVLL
ncbi:MAG: sugar ABC transporter substrate-binding protein [Lachnospiraceae bacterium]|nr:MAG: sugar ABC transporter substrate-binding protein [Lachnospiraceae bacterium]